MQVQPNLGNPYSTVKSFK